ncbi:MAG: class I SAM-dependent methyltransferase [Flavobacterium sp.]|nr:class I SAM-dependent methyltransferase [Flavobacterium sp.]
MVVYLTETNNDFSDKYIEIRTKENRILTDSEVEKLPYTTKSNPNHKEWRIRQQSSGMIFNYLKNKKESLQILDIGCGNGWFSHMLSQIENSKVIGLDINKIELEQASRVFNKENLQFFYGDIFKITKFEKQFNIITLNACIQYFPNFKQLLDKLKSCLVSDGEIHIIDSPFYKNEEISNAKERTNTYYKTLGYPEMSNFYFHHSTDAISDFKIRYQPSKNRFYNFFNRNNSPFMWLQYSHY